MRCMFCRPVVNRLTFSCLWFLSLFSMSTNYMTSGSTGPKQISRAWTEAWHLCWNAHNFCEICGLYQGEALNESVLLSNVHTVVSNAVAKPNKMGGESPPPTRRQAYLLQSLISNRRRDLGLNVLPFTLVVQIYVYFCIVLYNGKCRMAYNGLLTKFGHSLLLVMMQIISPTCTAFV